MSNNKFNSKMLRDLILESMEEAKRTKRTNSRAAKSKATKKKATKKKAAAGPSRAEVEIKKMEDNPNKAKNQLSNYLQSEDLGFKSPADYYDNEKLRVAATTFFEKEVASFKKTFKPSPEEIARLEAVYQGALDNMVPIDFSKVKGFPFSSTGMTNSSNIVLDKSSDDVSLDINTMNSTLLQDKKWIKMSSTDFETLKSTVPNLGDIFDVLKVDGGNLSSNVTESLKHNIKKLLREDADYYLKVKPEIQDQLKTDLSKYDDFNNDDGKLQPSDLEAVINLHPDGDVRSKVDSVFKTLKTLGVISNDSTYREADDIPSSEYYGRAILHLQTEDLPEDQVLKSWPVIKTILNPPDEPNDNHKTFINLLIKR